MYIYPDNLRSKATMWLWQLKDLAVTGIIFLIAVFVFASTGGVFLLAIAGMYAFLTIQVEDTTIMDFIRYGCAYFLTDQQHFEWRYTKNEQEKCDVYQRTDGHKGNIRIQSEKFQKW